MQLRYRVHDFRKLQVEILGTNLLAVKGSPSMGVPFKGEMMLVRMGTKIGVFEAKSRMRWVRAMHAFMSAVQFIPAKSMDTQLSAQVLETLAADGG